MRAAVGIDRQLPDLEFLARDRFLETLRDRDLINQPVSATGIGDVFGAVGEEDAAHQAVAVPVLAAGELREDGGVQFLVAHAAPPSTAVSGT